MRGKSSPEYQQALFRDTIEALQAAHDAASELEAYESENDLRGGIVSDPVEVRPFHKWLNPGNGELHEYEFVVELRTGGSGAEAGRLFIHWPTFLPVAIEPFNYSSHEPDKHNGIECMMVEFATPPLRAGESAYVVGVGAGHRMQYRVDDAFYRQHVRGQEEREVLWWQLVLDDGAEQLGSMTMRELQRF